VICQSFTDEEEGGEGEGHGRKERGTGGCNIFRGAEKPTARGNIIGFKDEINQKYDLIWIRIRL
jgi:hypothetical protein